MIILLWCVVALLANITCLQPGNVLRHPILELCVCRGIPLLHSRQLQQSYGIRNFHHPSEIQDTQILPFLFTRSTDDLAIVYARIHADFRIEEELADEGADGGGIVRFVGERECESVGLNRLRQFNDRFNCSRFAYVRVCLSVFCDIRTARPR